MSFQHKKSTDMSVVEMQVAKKIKKNIESIKNKFIAVCAFFSICSEKSKRALSRLWKLVRWPSALILGFATFIPLFFDGIEVGTKDELKIFEIMPALFWIAVGVFCFFAFFFVIQFFFQFGDDDKTKRNFYDLGKLVLCFFGFFGLVLFLLDPKLKSVQRVYALERLVEDNKLDKHYFEKVNNYENNLISLSVRMTHLEESNSYLIHINEYHETSIKDLEKQLSKSRDEKAVLSNLIDQQAKKLRRLRRELEENEKAVTDAKMQSIHNSIKLNYTDSQLKLLKNKFEKTLLQ